MPTYEYVCDACDHGFDEFQSYSEKPLTKCPKCKKKKLRRLFGTGASIIFKGSGFYETDYRSESYKSAEKAEADAAKPKEESKSDSKSESKTETKSDSKPAPAKPKKHKADKSGST